MLEMPSPLCAMLCSCLLILIYHMSVCVMCANCLQQAALGALRECGLGREAVALLKEMRTEHGITPNVYSFTAAVEACCAAGQVR